MVHEPLKFMEKMFQCVLKFATLKPFPGFADSTEILRWLENSRSRGYLLVHGESQQGACREIQQSLMEIAYTGISRIL
jgi:hypothetical protein